METLPPRSVPASSPSWIFWFKTILSCVLGICAGYFVITTVHWPLVGDASLVHYACFLIDHGQAPYRDFIDFNMPGAYFVNWMVIHTLGPGALALRLFDFGLFVILLAAMILIARPYDWFAGVYAAAILFITHGRDGVAQTGQRDLTIAVLLVTACAFLFEALRKNLWWPAALFGLCAGLATTIKPTVILFGPVLLFLAALTLYRRRKPFAALLATGLAGMLIPALATLAFLLRVHALGGFIYCLHTITMLNVKLGRLPAKQLWLHMVPATLQPIAIFWFFLAIANKRWRSWEDIALLAGIALGMVSFYVQAKGYPYHHYTEDAFLLLAAGLAFTAALRQRGTAKWLGITGLAFGVLWLVPEGTLKVRHYDWRNQEFITMLQGDLRHLGGPALSGKVQCMDLFRGCLTTLYDERLLQSTGTLFDCHMLVPDKEGIALELRKRFWSDILKNQPKVFVITNQFCLNPQYTFDKFVRWPEFQRYLDTNYALYAERTPLHTIKWWNQTMPPNSYRIYVLKSPVNKD